MLYGRRGLKGWVLEGIFSNDCNRRAGVIEEMTGGRRMLSGWKSCLVLQPGSGSGVMGGQEDEGMLPGEFFYGLIRFAGQKVAGAIGREFIPEQLLL